MGEICTAIYRIEMAAKSYPNLICKWGGANTRTISAVPDFAPWNIDLTPFGNCAID
jgi:hypothetical protein